jgi:hypothetical protein
MLRRRRGGQAAVLIALALFTLVIFVALATNMGILVNDKIRMQNAADAAAYTAAYREAQQLNKLVVLNQRIVDKVASCRDRLIGQPWPNQCDCRAQSLLAEAFINSCRVEIETLAEDFRREATYARSVSPALQSAMNTMDANVAGLSSSGSFMHDGPNAASMRGVYTVEGTLLNGFISEPAVANLVRVQNTKFNYPVLLQCPGLVVGCETVGVVPSERTHELRSWYYKDSDEPDIWVMAEASGTMRAAYLDIAYSSGGSDGGYFGASSTGGDDRMVAVGVAKPFGGSVGPTRASDSQRTGNTNPIGPYWAGQGTEFAKLAMVDEYRARLAGVGEWSSSTQADGESASTNPRDAFFSSSSIWKAHADALRH